MQGLVLGSRLLNSAGCTSTCRLGGPLRHMCMRRISRELAADDDSHEYRVSKVKASSLHLDESVRMRDEWETSRPQKKNSLVTLANVAMIAAAAGIATALCREVKEERKLWQNHRPQGRLLSADHVEGPYMLRPHPLKAQLDHVMACQRELEEELASLAAQPNTRTASRRRKEIHQELKGLADQHAQLMKDAKQLLLPGSS